MDALLARIKAYVSEAAPSKKLVALVIALAAFIAFVLNASLASKTDTVTVSSEPKSTVAIQAPSFFVHVVGEVKLPGVYSLEVGARLFDAIVAAGGFQKDADQASVNLARQLTDGEQIDVLKIGSGVDARTGSKSAAASLMSINRANESELEALPGVGPSLAGKIIDWRTANGGFKHKEDLLNVAGIGDKLFAGISKLITL